MTTTPITVRNFTSEFVDQLNANFSAIDTSIDSLSLATVAALKALTTRPEVVIVEGGTATNDGGAGTFFWVAGSTATADDINVVSPTYGTAGRYVRQHNGIKNKVVSQNSIFQGLSSKGLDFYLTDDVWGAGASRRVLALNYILNTDTTPVTFAGTPYAYPAIEDSSAILYDMGYVGVVSRNQMRHSLSNTQNSLDIAPTLTLDRRVANPASGSNVGSLQYLGVSSTINGVLTGSTPFSVTNGSPTVTVTLNNHNLSVGDYVYFPNQVVSNGITLGGAATDSNNNNKYGSYYVQSTPTVNTFTITAAMNASSTGTFGGSNFYINYPQYRKSMSLNPFTTVNGSGTVTVTHVNHQLSPTTGTNPGNPRASTTYPSSVFYEGATAVGGATIKGAHQVQTTPTADTYTITLNAISDVVATATSGASGGGTPTFSHGGTNSDLLVAGIEAVILDNNVNYPSGQLQFVFGSPPNYGAGNAASYIWGAQGLYATGLNGSLGSPGEGGIHFRKGKFTSATSTDNYLDLDTTTSGQNAGIKLLRAAVEKIQIVADSSNLFRIRDVPNTANLLSYNGTTAALTLGDIVLAGGGGITLASAVTFSSTMTFNAKSISTASGTGSLTLGLGDAWSTYTPTITSGSGTFTSVSGSGRYKQVNKHCEFEVEVVCTTVGTAGTYINLPLPNSLLPQSNFSAIGINRSTGKAVGLLGYAGSNTANLFLYDGTFPITTGQTISVSGLFETQ